MCTGQSTPPSGTVSNFAQSIVANSNGTASADSAQRRKTMALAMRATGLGAPAGNTTLGG